MPSGRFATPEADSPPRARATSPGSADRRDQILRAAADVISEVGFGETRIAHVAARAGVAGGTIIYHFGTLDALLVEALRVGEEAFYEEAERRVAKGRTSLDRLKRFVDWVFTTDEDNTRLWSLWLETWSHAARHPKLAQGRAVQDARWRAMIVTAIAPAALTKRQADLFGVSFGALLDGLIVQVALGDEHVGANRARTIAMANARAMLAER